MNNEKFKTTMSYFNDEVGIKVPEQIQNAINDVFRENDDIDQVLVYHPEEIEEFCKDITLLTELIVSIDGLSSGTVQNVYTYYGDPEYLMKERISLAKDDSVYEEVRDTYRLLEGRYSNIYDTDDYYVILLEEIKFENGEASRTFNLLIFCPESVEEISPEDQKFRNIYNQLIEEEN